MFPDTGNIIIINIYIYIYIYIYIFNKYYMTYIDLKRDYLIK